MVQKTMFDFFGRRLSKILGGVVDFVGIKSLSFEVSKMLNV